ncbi:MAG: A/G-specific adenine glycosylase [Odoribacter sp.]|nr:A/G-specific adenine glycosylase [Odoribacter sp.]
MNIGEILIRWYIENKRQLPWRETTDPYQIWVSEIILQQTRVAQGLGYFNRFMERFPDVRTLADAEEDEVMRYWQGLGYYSRARNLHAAAREIRDRFGGEFPRKYEEVLSLKGIGEYTAAAICSFAWRQPYAVVDGNVYRVLGRVFGIDTPIDSGAGKNEFAELARVLLDKERPDLYNQAIMDFGAVQCTPRVPDCLYCPLRDGCVAFASGKVGDLPVKSGKTVVKPRDFNYLHIHCKGVTLLSRRNAKDIWRNLYEYPLIETGKAMDFADLQQTGEYGRLMAGVNEIRVLRMLEMPKHVLSHRIIYACFYELEVSNFSEGMNSYVQVCDAELEKYAVSRLIELYREK